MMEKSILKKYCREVVSTVVYTLYRVHAKKGKNTSPFELWYGYTPNVNYFKIFGSRC